MVVQTRVLELEAAHDQALGVDVERQAFAITAEVLHLSLRIAAPDGYTVTPPAVADSLGDFAVLARDERPARLEGGKLVTEPAGALVHACDFGEGRRETTATSWADVVTGQFSTGVEDIEVYSELGWLGRAGYRTSALAVGLGGVGLWRRAVERIRE